MAREIKYYIVAANALPEIFVKVAEAKRLGLDHKEYHSQVEYVVAHGISSTVEDKKVIIGSAHFVFEDEAA